MKFDEAVATASCMFCKPLLWAKQDERDEEAQKALYRLKKMKRNKKKDKDPKYVDDLLYFKSRIF
jgi:hypothetical protein